jgi:preprotein translocase subunit SecA
VLEGRDMGGPARDEVANMLGRLVDEYCAGDYIEEWDLEGLFSRVAEIFPVSFDPDDLDADQIDRDELSRLLADDAHELYDRREAELGEELMRALERYLLLDIIDSKWREHLHDMDYLRQGIHLRGFAQIEPLVAYKNEAFTLFQDLMNSIWSDFARMVYNVEVTIEGENGHEAVPPPPAPRRGAGSTTGRGSLSYSGGTLEQPSVYAMAGSGTAGQPGEPYLDEEAEPMPVVQQRVVAESEKIGRNDPCWCGSGKKFKKCHGAAA